MSFAKLIVVEGGDAQGKFTQSLMLCKTLTKLGNKTKLVEIPFDDHFTYKMIYAMLNNGYAKQYQNVFQFLQFVNKLLFQLLVLIRHILTSDFIILDRWSLSSIVYGDATNVNKIFNRVLSSLLIKPDLTIVLHGNKLKKSNEDDYESDTVLQKNVRELYKMHALNNDIDHVLVNNCGTREEVHANIIKEVNKYFSI